MSLNVGELVGYLSIDDSKWTPALAKAQGELKEQTKGLDKVAQHAAATADAQSRFSREQLQALERETAAQSKYAREVKAFGSGSLQARSAQRELRKASDEVKTSLDEAGGAATRSTKAFSLIGGAIAAGALMGLAKLKQFASGAVDAFGAVEDATGAASVVFGKSLPEVLEFADKASASFGMSKRQAIEAQNTFATFGKGAGLAGEPLAGFSKQLTGLAGDLASFKGTSTEDAITAVGAALRGEMEPIRRYGVLLDDSTLRQEAMKMGLIKSVKEGLTPQQRALAAQAAILSQTKDAQGDYNRTANSTANVHKTLTAETENAQAAIGKKLAPAVTAARKIFLGWMRELPQLLDTLGALGGWAKDHAGFFKVIAVVIGLVTAAIVAQNIALAISSGRLKAWILQTGLVRGATAAWAAVQWAINVALSANPIGLVVKALALLVAGVVYAYTHFKTFHNIVNGAINGVLRAAQGLANGIIKVVNIIIAAWNALPFHKDIKQLANVEFPQLAAAAEKAADGVHAALSGRGKRGKAAPIGGKTPEKNLYDTLDLSSALTGAAGGKGGDAAAKKTETTLKKYQATVTKNYAKVHEEIASFVAKRADITKSAAARELAAQSRYDDAAFKLNRSYRESLASAQKSYDASDVADRKKHAEALAGIEKSYLDKVAQLNQQAADKRQSIVQKSIEMLTGAFSQATSIDIGKMFTSGGGVAGLLATLKTKLFGAQELARNAAELAAQGYSQSFIQQVVAQGPDAGNAMAQAVLAATPEAAGELKNLFGAIQDVADTGVTELATKMNSGATLATRALMAEYAQVGTDLQELLAQEYVNLSSALAKENESFDGAIAANQASLLSAQAAAAQTLANGLADADDSLKEALAASAASFKDDIENLQKDTMDRLGKLKAELITVANLIAGISGGKAGSKVLGQAPSFALPKLPTIGSSGQSSSSSGEQDRNSGRGGVTIEKIDVYGYSPDDAVNKFGRELNWRLAGAW